MKARVVWLLLVPLLGQALAGLQADGGDGGDLCDGALQEQYCSAWYGGDYHTACRFCGRGTHCPEGNISGRKITDTQIR